MTRPQLTPGPTRSTTPSATATAARDTATVLLTVVKDATAPTVSAPAESFYAQTVANTTSRFDRSPGRAAMPAPGIKKFELAVSVNGGAFTNLTLPADRHLAQHHPDRREELQLPGPRHRQRGQRQRLGQRPGVQAGPLPAEQHERRLHRAVGHLDDLAGARWQPPLRELGRRPVRRSLGRPATSPLS